jgi:hypothetical protein
VRLPIVRRGKRSARAAASRNRAAKSDVAPSASVTTRSTSADAGKKSATTGAASLAGSRKAIPSSDHTASASPA